MLVMLHGELHGNRNDIFEAFLGAGTIGGVFIINRIVKKYKEKVPPYSLLLILSNELAMYLNDMRGFA